jgi:hypothetical protein
MNVIGKLPVALVVMVVATVWPAASWAGSERVERSLQSLVSQQTLDQAFEVVSRHASALQTCFTKVPGAEGAPLELSFTIGKAGRATDIRVESPALEGTSIPACVSAAVAQWSFPGSVGARVSFPLEFARG